MIRPTLPLRAFPAILLVGGLLAMVFGAPATAQTAPYCQPGQAPVYVFGFKALHDALGEVMGEPLECEHANPENGDALQQTANGLSFYRKSTNTPTFTNGFEHWAITADGLVYWTGESIDPPPNARVVPPPAQTAGAVVEVRMVDLRYEPATITIPAGATVRWVNDDPFEHTVTADDERFDSGLVLGGETYSLTFDQPGRYGYYCVIHGSPGSGQFGTVVVLPA